MVRDALSVAKRATCLESVQMGVSDALYFTVQGTVTFVSAI